MKHRLPVGLQSEVVIPETRLLRYFVAVAEELNFTRAAERLHVAQQALSAQIRLLERDLGVELLRRTTRKVELTPAGNAFLEDARQVLVQAERAVARARRYGRGEVGTLAIGYTETASYAALPVLLTALRSTYPDLEIITRALSTHEVTAAVADGRYDVALARAPLVPPDLACETLLREPLVAALSAHHHLAGEAAIPLAALAGETPIIWPRELAPGYHDALADAFRTAGLTPALDTSVTGAALWNEVASGRRVTLAVASLAEQLPHGVRLVPLSEPVPHLDLSLVWREDAITEQGRRFLDLARQFAIAEGWTDDLGHSITRVRPTDAIEAQPGR